MDQPSDNVETVPINHGEVNRVNQQSSRGQQRNLGTRVRETNQQTQPRRSLEHGGARRRHNASRAEAIDLEKGTLHSPNRQVADNTLSVTC